MLETGVGWISWLKNPEIRDFPDGPVVKTSNAMGAGLILGWAAKIPHAVAKTKQKIIGGDQN